MTDGLLPPLLWPVGVPTSEYSQQFLQGMLDRMAMGYHRYGLVADTKDVVDHVSSAITRLRRYAATGNTEFLMDAANMAMIEFMVPRHDKAHFAPTDDDASPGRVRVGGGLDKRSNKELLDE